MKQLFRFDDISTLEELQDAVEELGEHVALREASDVDIETPFDLVLVEETLTDGSKVKNIKIVMRA